MHQIFQNLNVSRTPTENLSDFLHKIKKFQAKFTKEKSKHKLFRLMFE